VKNARSGPAAGRHHGVAQPETDALDDVESFDDVRSFDEKHPHEVVFDDEVRLHEGRSHDGIAETEGNDAAEGLVFPNLDFCAFR
jgi:hypothetical protein